MAIGIEALGDVPTLNPLQPFIPDAAISEFTVEAEFGGLALGAPSEDLMSSLEQKLPAIVREGAKALKVARAHENKAKAAQAQMIASTSGPAQQAAEAARDAHNKAAEKAIARAMELRARYERAQTAYGLFVIGKRLRGAGEPVYAAPIEARAKTILNTPIPLPTPGAMRAEGTAETGASVLARTPSPTLPLAARKRLEQVRRSIGGEASREIDQVARGRRQISARQPISDARRRINDVVRQSTYTLRELNLGSAVQADMGDFADLGDGGLGFSLSGAWNSVKSVVKSVIPEHTIVGKALSGNPGAAAKAIVKGVSRKPAPGAQPPPPPPPRVQAIIEQGAAQIEKVLPDAVKSSSLAGWALPAGGIALALGFLFLRK